MLLKFTFVHIYLLCKLLRAQEIIPGQSVECAGSILSFPYCQARYARAATCQKVSSEESIACVCNQEFFDTIIGCQGEWRQCALSNAFDSNFTEYIASWHSACDRHLQAPVATTPIFQLSVVPYKECGRFTDACRRWSQDWSTCKNGRSIAAVTTSCLCTASMLSLASVCEVDGNRSCLLTSADLTRLWEYRSCPNAASYYNEERSNGRTTRISLTVSSSSIATPANVPPLGPLIPTQTISSVRSGAEHTSWSLGTSLVLFVTIVFMGVILI